jgi:hypothetical protein
VISKRLTGAAFILASLSKKSGIATRVALHSAARSTSRSIHTLSPQASH